MKKEGISNWYNTSRESFKIYNDDPTLNEIKQNYEKMLNSFIPIKDIQDKWSNNFSKAVGLVDQNMEIFYQIQVIFQKFLFLCEKGINTNNEDTFVHGMLHDLLNQIFCDPTFSLIWVNSESFISKNCHTSTLENKVKPKDSTSLLASKDLIMLSNYQSDAHAFGFMKWISNMMEYIECFKSECCDPNRKSKILKSKSK
ncbi:hypothetical protein C1646_775839 [Rhizophagus diaphanus]|nr:hypothetical protein C1646_775839 [Rhizophagus diaphanus] [Rhizophagus sp. MUCL 43196]